MATDKILEVAPSIDEDVEARVRVDNLAGTDVTEYVSGTNYPKGKIIRRLSVYYMVIGGGVIDDLNFDSSTVRVSVEGAYKNTRLSLPVGTVLAVGNGSMENVINGNLPIGRELAVPKDSGIVEGDECSYQLLKDRSTWAGIGGTNLILKETFDLNLWGKLGSGITITDNALFQSVAGTTDIYGQLIYLNIKPVTAGDKVTFVGKIRNTGTSNITLGGNVINFPDNVILAGETKEFNVVGTAGIDGGYQIHIRGENVIASEISCDVWYEKASFESSVPIPLCETTSPDYNVKYQYYDIKNITGLYVMKFYGKPKVLDANGVWTVLSNEFGNGYLGLALNEAELINNMNDGVNRVSILFTNGIGVAYLNGIKLSTTINNLSASTGALQLNRHGTSNIHSPNVGVAYSVLSEGNFAEEEAKLYSLFDIEFPVNSETYPVGRSIVKRNNYGDITNIVNPNLLINGDMSVDQRNNFGQITLTSSGYTADRWNVRSNTGTVNVRVAPDSATAIGSYIYIAHSGATLSGYLFQPIEIAGKKYNKFENKIATLSFETSHQQSVDQFTEVYWLNVTDGVTASPIAKTVVDSSAVGKKIATFKIPAITNKDEFKTYVLRVLVRYGEKVDGTVTIPSNCVVRFTNFKLELGSVATEFISDDPATNLMKCKRYYEVIEESYTRVSPSIDTGVTVKYEVEKRVTPTISYTTTAGTVSEVYAKKTGVTLLGTSNIGGKFILANIKINSEL